MRRSAVLATAIALATVIHAPLGAQARPATPPSQPGAALAPTPIDAEFASWSVAQRATRRAELPGYMLGGRFEVLAMSPRSREAIGADSSFALMVRNCRDAMPSSVTFPDSALAAIEPWAAFDEAAARVPLVTFAVVPTRGGMSDCGAPMAGRMAAIARGVRFGSEQTYRAASDARAAELWVDGARVEFALAGSVPVVHVSSGSIWRDSTAQLRLYVPVDAFAPRPNGGWPVAELRVWSAAGGAPTVVPIRASEMAALWRAELPWRAERLDATAGRATAVAAVAALDAPRISDDARREERLRLAFGLDAGGDAAASRSVLATVVAADPCLTFDASVDARHSRFIDATRPPARCTTIPLPMVAARALVPGLGQRAVGKTNMGWAVTGTVVSTMALGFMSHSKARSIHADYERYTAVNFLNPIEGVVNTETLYSRADDALKQGNLLITVGASIWALSAVDAMLTERRHARDVREVSGVRAPEARRMSIVPLPGARGVGISIDLFR